jgi:hypothetical protein
MSEQGNPPYPGLSDFPQNPAQPAVTPAGNPQDSGVASSFTEDMHTGAATAPATDTTPGAISMQQGAPEPDRVPDTVANTKLPDYMPPSIQEEKDVGAARVRFHQEREALLAAKRAKEQSEEAQVASATEANKAL